jgi:leucyl aminopeptidase
MVELIPVTDPTVGSAGSSEFDAVVLVGPIDGFSQWQALDAHLQRIAKVDAEVTGQVTLHAVSDVAGGRLVVAPVKSLDHDTDDVRRFSDAAAKGLLRARDAGARRPLLFVGTAPSRNEFAHVLEVSLVSAAGALWQPLEAREAHGETTLEPIEAIGFLASRSGERTARRVGALESGRRLARDLGGTEPERMAPPRFAELCEQAFAGTEVKTEIVSDPDTLLAEYPMLMAVARASMPVERHRPRVIRLEYTGKGPIERTLLFAGKGLVYDTGGADLKVGGHMAGMSRDKCGGAAVAGFLKTVAELAPDNVRVIAEIGAVRNSIGADSFVSDEILTSHAGVRVRIGNTDAEGRLVLADLLSHLRERAMSETAPALFCVATLTGHAALAVGPYTAVVENGPARDEGIGALLSERGDLWGDPFDLSRSRREDFEFIKGRTRADDILQCNNAPSSQTTRGHQFPMAFLAVASGLDAHGRHSGQALPYSHLDVAGSATEGDDWQHGRPTGAPIVALAASFLE